MDHMPSSELAKFTAFAAGRASAVVGTTLSALVDDSLKSPLVRALWPVARDGGSLDEALEVLGQLGFSKLTDFVMVAWEAEQCRVVVRGQVGAEMFDTSGDLTQSISGDSVRSWAEYSVADAGSVRIRMGDSVVDALAFEGQQIAGGLVSASALELFAPSTVELTGGPESSPDLVEDDSVDSEPIDSVLVEGELLEDDLFADEAPIEQSEESEQSEQSEQSPTALADNSADPFQAWAKAPPSSASETDLSDDDVVSPDVAAAQSDHEATIFDAPELPAETSTEIPAEAPAEQLSEPSAEEVVSAPAPADGAPSAYDDLFGATQFRSVESAAVRVEDAGGMVESVPNSDGGGSITVQDSDHDGKTITVEELRRMQAGSSGASIAAAATGISGEFLAVSCAAGHLNPPHGDACRVCGQVIHTQKPNTVSSINLGTFRFSTGITVPVTRSMLIGRSPKVSGAVDGQVPELVSVPSPSQDISRNHVEVHVEGWQVLVVDKGSTNGTVVILPNRDPQRLRPDEPFPLSIGARVSLADEVDFVFEVAE